MEKGSDVYVPSSVYSSITLPLELSGFHQNPESRLQCFCSCAQFPQPIDRRPHPEGRHVQFRVDFYDVQYRQILLQATIKSRSKMEPHATTKMNPAIVFSGKPTSATSSKPSWPTPLQAHSPVSATKSASTPTAPEMAT